MNKILFSGCSYVEGYGLPFNKDDSNLFCNQLMNLVPEFCNKVINNIGVGGYSNEKIFVDTAYALLTDQYKFALVCWTSYPRFVCYPGLEEYECKKTIAPFTTAFEHNGNTFSISKKKFEQLNEIFPLLMHDHYSIVDIMSYVNILKKIAEITNTKIFFVNNICHWDELYFEQFSSNNIIKPEQLTAYTNSLLNSNNRDDSEINALFKKMSLDYENKGGIHSELWLNLYKSFNSMMVDFGNDNLHPGMQSHIIFAEFLAKQLKNHDLS